MAKFILGNSLRSAFFDTPVLRHSLWFVDLIIVGTVLILATLLPVAWASALGARLGRLSGRFLKRRTRHARANLSVALSGTPREEIDELVGQVWENAGALLAEYPKLPKIADPRRDFLDIDIVEQIPAYHEPDRPAIFVSAHLANWEVIGLAITRMGIRSCALYTPPTNPWLDRLLRHYRRALGCDLVARDHGARALVTALKAGRSPIMITDRWVAQGKPVPLFGLEKLTSTLPARLALRFDVPLVPVQVERLPGPRFRVRFHPPIRPSDPTAEPDCQAVDLTRQINETFEQWVRARPGEWFCTSKIYRSTILQAKLDDYDSLG